MTQTDREIAENIAHRLMGSTQSLTYVLEGIGREDLELDSEFCAVIDSLVFECTSCGWWCEIGDMLGDWTCSDCEDEA